MKITKFDLARYADFTVNISDQKVDFQINDAGLMDVAPIITRERYGAILALEPEQLPTEAVPFPPVESEHTITLRGLYAAVVPFWTMCTYKRIIAFHGVDVTQAGLVVDRGQEFEQVSDKRRGEILGSIRSKVHFFQSELEKYMNDNNLNAETDSCTDTGNRRNFGIRVAKNKRYQ